MFNGFVNLLSFDLDGGCGYCKFGYVWKVEWEWDWNLFLFSFFCRVVFDKEEM